MKVKFLVVNDKTFKQNGQLFYPTKSMSSSFTSWVPQFFGNTMLVNGVLWPVLKLNKGIHRIVLLNACQSRYLNVYFENRFGKRVPMRMLRVDNDFYQNEIVVDEMLATIATRFQFIIDLTQEDGEIIMKNNAPTPFPNGQPITDQFTSQILKIEIDHPVSKQHKISQKTKSKNVRKHSKNMKSVKESIQKYPFFDEGQKVYSTLFDVLDDNGQMQAMFIDGQAMINGMECPSSTFKPGKTYDFYFINLTPDTHPIHFHLINLQKVKQFPIDVAAYSKDYFDLNGGMPSKYGFPSVHLVIDPQDYRTGDDILPNELQKVFRDTIDAHPDHVTVMRVKFAKNDGTQFHSFDIRGQRYVMHCHILQHEDNEMMKHYCLE